MHENIRHHAGLDQALSGRVVRGSGEVAPSEGPKNPPLYAVLDLRFGGTMPEIAQVDLTMGAFRPGQLLEVLSGNPLSDAEMALLRPDLAEVWKRAIQHQDQPQWGDLMLGREGVHVHADSFADSRVVLSVEGLQRGFWERMGDFLNQGPKVTLTSGRPAPLEVVMSFLRSLPSDLQAIANQALADLHADLKVETGWTSEICDDLVRLHQFRSQSFFEQLMRSRSA